MSELYCNVKGKKRKVLLRMSAPFPSHFGDSVSNEEKKHGNFFLINDNLFLLRVFLKIPIINSDHYFLWSVWGSIRKEDFLKNFKLSTSTPIDSNFLYIGKLESDLLFYSKSSGEKLSIRHTAEGGELLPTAEVDGDTELGRDSRSGVTMEKVTLWMEKLYS